MVTTKLPHRYTEEGKDLRAILSSPAETGLLLLLGTGPKTFDELKGITEASSGSLNYYLPRLSGMGIITSNGDYQLTPYGREMLAYVKDIVEC